MGASCNCSKNTDNIKEVVALSVTSGPAKSTGQESGGSATDLSTYKQDNASAMHKKILEAYNAAVAQSPPDLKTLKLAALKAKDKDWNHIFTLLTHCTRLQRLHLWKVTISAKSLDQLGDRLATLTQLEYLMLGDMSLGSYGITHLRDGLKELVRIRELILTVNFLSADHIEILMPALINLRNLEILSMDENELSNKGSELIAGLLEKLQRVRDVSLKFNSVGHKGLMALVPWVTRRRGLVVRLDGNDLNDDEYDLLEQAHLDAAA